MGTTIRVDDEGDSNQNFTEVAIPGRCGGVVTANCPFNGPEGSYFDKQYRGFPIVQLVYGSSSHCLAISSTGTNAVLGNCIGTTTGTGGSNGAAFVDHNGYMINVYRTNIDEYGNNASCMQQIGGAGGSSTVDLNLPTGQGCELWAQF